MILMKYIKDFIVQVNSKEESEKLGKFLRDNSFSTDGFAMDSNLKNSIYVISDYMVINCTSYWSRYSNYRLFQNLDELKRHFESVNININNYEIY